MQLRERVLHDSAGMPAAAVASRVPPGSGGSNTGGGKPAKSPAPAAVRAASGARVLQRSRH